MILQKKKIGDDYFQGKEFDLEILHTNSKGECIDKIIKAYYEKVAALVMNARGFIYAAHFINDNIKGIKIKYYEKIYCPFVINCIVYLK